MSDANTNTSTKEKKALNHSDYPEFEKIRKFLGNMSDREKVAVLLMYVLMGADSYSIEAGRYLDSLHHETVKSLKGEIDRIVADHPDQETKDVAALTAIIYGLT